MKKSKEQIMKELGADQPGYWFSFNSNNSYMCYWSSKESVQYLYERLTRKFSLSTDVQPIHGWRRSQTDWQSVNGLVLYDRFGSKITLNENPKEIETKLTDAGQKHWDLYCHWEILDSYFYVSKIFECWGGMTAYNRLSKEMKEMHRLFPANEKL